MTLTCRRCWQAIGSVSNAPLGGGNSKFEATDLDWSDNDVLMRALLRWVTGASPCSLPAIYLPLLLRGAP